VEVSMLVILRFAELVRRNARTSRVSSATREMTTTMARPDRRRVGRMDGVFKE
jgi:hypothetical protein